MKETQKIFRYEMNYQVMIYFENVYINNNSIHLLYNYKWGVPKKRNVQNIFSY